MKKILIAIAVFSINALAFANGGNNDSTSTEAAAPVADKKVPSVVVKTTDGTKVNTADFANDGKPYVINFWATWCAPCKKELDNIAEKYADWQAETGVKIIAISIDDTRTSSKVATTVESKGWEFEVYLDENKDFARAMNVGNPPYTFLVDGNGNIVYEHIGYAEGDEDHLLEKIKELTKK